jgi:hypothetical protein
VCRRPYDVVTGCVSLFRCQWPIDSLNLAQERPASGSVVCEPNCKESNEGCDDAEGYLKDGVELHDVSTKYLGMYVCMYVCVPQVVGGFRVEKWELGNLCG